MALPTDDLSAKA